MLEATHAYYCDQKAGALAGCTAALATNGATQHQQQQTVDAGRPHPLLLGRGQADAALSLAMRPAENVPVYVMLPLDTVRRGPGHCSSLGVWGGIALGRVLGDPADWFLQLSAPPTSCTVQIALQLRLTLPITCIRTTQLS